MSWYSHPLPETSLISLLLEKLHGNDFQYLTRRLRPNSLNTSKNVLRIWRRKIIYNLLHNEICKLTEEHVKQLAAQETRLRHELFAEFEVLLANRTKAAENKLSQQKLSLRDFMKFRCVTSSFYYHFT